MPINKLVPSASASPSGPLTVNTYTLIDETVASADGSVNRTGTNDQTGAGTASWALTNTTGVVNTVNSATFRVRARLSSMGNDDTSYRFRLVVGGSNYDISFDENDTSYSDKTISVGSFTKSQYDAAYVELVHSSFNKNQGFDGSYLEVDAFELEVDYSSTIAIETDADAAGVSFPWADTQDGQYIYSTYYFDASDSGPTDPDAAWDNDANGFDGSISTYTNSPIRTNGTVDSRYLEATGTTAPAFGGDIATVYYRVFANREPGEINFATLGRDIYSGSESVKAIPEASFILTEDSTWEIYHKLDTPTGGWTWQKLNDLRLRVWQPNAVNGKVFFYVGEIEVAYAPIAEVDADATGSSTTQAKAVDTTWWSWDANHFTMDNNDDTHTMDGYHVDEADSASFHVAGTSTVTGVSPNYTESVGSSVGTSAVVGNNTSYTVSSSSGKARGHAPKPVTETFYFDAHTLFNDYNDAWTDDANAYDGDTGTYAQIAGTDFILGDEIWLRGTNADSTQDWEIIQDSVRARAYLSGTNAAAEQNVNFSDYQSVIRGTLHDLPITTPGWTDWVALPESINPWDWVWIRGLRCTFYPTQYSGSYTEHRFHKAEVELTYYGPIKYKAASINKSKARADGTSATVGITGNIIVGVVANAVGESTVLGEYEYIPQRPTDINATGESVALGIVCATATTATAVIGSSATNGLASVTANTVAAAQANSVTLGETTLLGQGNIEADGTSASLAEATAIWLTDTSSIAESTASADSGALFATVLAATGDSAVNGIIENAATVVYEQEGFRFRNDDGTEITATWAASQDVNYQGGTEKTVRLRVLLCATGNPDAQQVTLQYKKTTEDETKWRTIT